MFSEDRGFKISFSPDFKRISKALNNRYETESLHIDTLQLHSSIKGLVFKSLNSVAMNLSDSINMDFSIKSFILICCFFIAGNSFAKTFTVPSGICANEHSLIDIDNRNQQNQRFWIQLRSPDNGGQISEFKYDVLAKKNLKIELSEFRPFEQMISIKTYSDDLYFRFSCAEKPVQWNLPLQSKLNPNFQFMLDSSSTQQILLTNMQLRPQVVKLRYLGEMGRIIQENQIRLEHPYVTLASSVPQIEGVRSVEVIGEWRMSAYLRKTNNQFAKDHSDKIIRTSVPEDRSYFLVKPKDEKNNDSYIVAITDPIMIQKAREQIMNPTLEKIVIARATMETKIMNRNLLDPLKTPYSWSVLTVDAFADFAHIDCDGSPELVEERLELVMNTGGSICFWRYRITRELTPEEINRGFLAKQPQLGR